MKKNYIPSIILFFFLSELVVIILVLDLVVYPAMNISKEAFLSGLAKTIINQSAGLVGFSIILFFILKPLNKIYQLAELSKKQEKINLLERNIKKGLIIMNVLGFIAVPILATFLRVKSDGFLRWSTVRFVLATAVFGFPMANLQINFVNSIFINIRDNLKVYDINIKKNKFVQIKFKLFMQYTYLLFAIIFIFSLAIISAEEKVAGINIVAYSFDKTKTEKANGYFTQLIDSSMKSEDIKLKEEAQKLKNGWSDYSIKNNIKTVFFSFILILLSLFFYFLYSNNVSNHLKNIINKISDILKHDKDLSHFLIKTSDDEIGKLQVLFNQLILQLNDTFYDVFETGQKLIKNADEEKKELDVLIETNNKLSQINSETNDQLINLTDTFNNSFNLLDKTIASIKSNKDSIINQSSMIEQESASIEEMISSLESVSANTFKLSMIGEKLNEVSSENLKLINNVNEAIMTISEKGTDIKDITSTIKAIADQTGLLAMNAAIEAAHAGEAGKGFSVVADEIRNLSEGSSEQVQGISKLLATMTDIIESTTGQSKKMDQEMKDMQNDISETIQLINEINSAVQEQVSNTNENAQTVSQLIETTANVMGNLDSQDVKTVQLELSINNVKESLNSIEKTWENQQGFYNNLFNYFNKFSTFFSEVSVDLKKLNNQLENIQFLSKEKLNQVRNEDYE